MCVSYLNRTKRMLVDDITEYDQIICCGRFEYPGYIAGSACHIESTVRKHEIDGQAGSSTQTRVAEVNDRVSIRMLGSNLIHTTADNTRKQHS